MESLSLLAVLVVAGIILSSAVGFHTMQVDLLLLLHRENSTNGGTGPQYLPTHGASLRQRNENIQL